MLETSEERVSLLKKGFNQKQIEELYIQGNNFKIVNLPILIELEEIEDRQKKKKYVKCLAAIRYTGMFNDRVLGFRFHPSGNLNI